MAKRAFITFLVIFSVKVAIAGWQHLPCNGMINSIVANGNIIYSGNGPNGFWLSQDNGLTWTQKNNGLPVPDIAAIALYGNTLLAGTPVGIYKSQNNGDSWSYAGNNATITCISVMGNRIYMGTAGSGIFVSQDIGATWSAVSNGLYSLEITSLLVVDSTLFAGTISGLFMSSDYGGHWIRLGNGIPVAHVHSLCFNNSSIYASTYYQAARHIYRSVDLGTTWIEGSNGIPVNEVVYSLTGNNSCLFAGMGSGVYLSNDSAKNWIPKNNGFPVHPIALSLSLNQTYLFAGTDTGVWRVPLTELGIIDLNIAHNISVYPNPTHSYIKISPLPEYSSPFSIDIYTLEGIKVKHLNLSGRNEHTIAIDELQKGIYVMKIQCVKSVYNSKFVVE